MIAGQQLGPGHNPDGKWSNWYRVPAISRSTGVPKAERIGCSICGHGEIIEPGAKFRSHCARFMTKAEAESYAPNIYNFCDYLGAFSEGKSP